MISGVVNDDGRIIAGTGFTVDTSTPGVYDIIPDVSITKVSAMLVTLFGNLHFSSDLFPKAQEVSGRMRVVIFHAGHGTTQAFSFLLL